MPSEEKYEDGVFYIPSFNLILFPLPNKEFNIMPPVLLMLLVEWSLLLSSNMKRIIMRYKREKMSCSIDFHF